jgi:hypothetical protein
MTSSQNPFETSSKHYVNNYDSKRKGVPSIANTGKVYGDGPRESYLRSGHESSSNPLAANVNYAEKYASHTGKKVTEYNTAPQ